MNLRINYKEPVKEIISIKPGLLMQVYYTSIGREPEEGWISSWNERVIFVRFELNVDRLTWDGATSQACCPEDLYHVDYLGKKRMLEL